MSKDRVPPGQVITRELPIQHHGPVIRIDRDTWQLRLFGSVGREVVLDWDGFMRLPSTTVTCDVHCATGWSRLDTVWEGVRTADIVGLVNPLPDVGDVLIHSAGEWTGNLTLEDFMARDVILAHSYDGMPLTPEHGAPVRLLVPHFYFWKSTKWVVGIELTARAQTGRADDTDYRRLPAEYADRGKADARHDWRRA